MKIQKLQQIIKEEYVKSVLSKRLTVTEANLPKRFTVKTKQRIDGTVYNPGDYALKKKRSGGGIYLNMDNGEMLGVDAANISQLEEGKLTESRGVMNYVKNAIEDLMFDGDVSEKEAAMELVTAIADEYKFKAKIREGKLTEALARGLKPLLMVGSTIKSTVGENVLVKLSDKFDRIDDEQAEDVASHLNMAIELMQDGSPSEGRAFLKKFNNACKDALKGKSVKSAFEGVNESRVTEATPVKVTKQMWGKMSEYQRMDALLTVVKDPGKAEKFLDKKWNQLPSGFETQMHTEGKSPVNASRHELREMIYTELFNELRNQSGRSI